DHWDLFGGKLEPGETPVAALVRELEEELAIDARIGGRLGISLYDDPRDGCIFRCPVYRVARWKGEIRLNPEHSRAEWLTPAQLRRRALAHPDIPGLCARALGRRP
ncbi:MAG: NUDIX domain-containing protein, partial [Candidatus Eisenbacteria bacterium]